MGPLSEYTSGKQHRGSGRGRWENEKRGAPEMRGERTEAPHSPRERSPRLRKPLDKLSKCLDFSIELQHMYQI